MPSRVAPDNPRHAAVEKQVAKYLDELNYLTAAATYHEVMPANVQNRLKKLDTPEALYVRTRADRIAVHKRLPICFLWEVKTNQSVYSNITIEALPLCHHLRSGVRCLYVLENNDGQQYGFWTTSVPRFRRYFVPDRWKDGDPMRQFFVAEMQATLGARVIETCAPSGSGDPFVLLLQKDFGQLFDWQQELVRFTESPATPAVPVVPQDLFSLSA